MGLSLLLLLVLSGCGGGVKAAPAALSTPSTAPASPAPSGEAGPLLEQASGAAGMCAENTPCAPVVATLTVATASASPTETVAPCLPGRVERHALESQILSRQMTVRVYLPPCYNPQRASGYPVIYLLHGQSMDATVWDDLGAVADANQLIADQNAPPFLIVMPQEDYYLQDIRASLFGAAVVGEVVPWADANFNTCPARACRALGGISRGATWAVMLGFENSELFAAVGAHSLPFPPMSSSRLHTLTDAAPGGPPALRIDIGSADPYLSDAQRFETSLNLVGVPHDWIVQDGTHNAGYWKSHMQEYLRWYVSELGG